MDLPKHFKNESIVTFPLAPVDLPKHFQNKSIVTFPSAPVDLPKHFQNKSIVTFPSAPVDLPKHFQNKSIITFPSAPVDLPEHFQNKSTITFPSAPVDFPKHFQDNSIITFHCTSVDLPIMIFPRQKHHYLSLGPCGLAPSFHDKRIIDSNTADYVALFLENGEALVITLNHQLCLAIMYTYIIVIQSLGTAPSPCLFNNPLIRSLHLCINLKCKSPSPSTSSLFPLLYT